MCIYTCVYMPKSIRFVPLPILLQKICISTILLLIFGVCYFDNWIFLFLISDIIKYLHSNGYKCSDSASCRLDKVYLIVYIVTDDIKGTKPPSSKQVLGFFLRLHRQQGKTLHNPATRTIAKLAEFRNKEKIPVRDKQHFIRKVEDVFTKKKGLKKNPRCRTET